MDAPADRVDEKLLAELFDLLSDGGDGLRTAYDLFLTGVPARFADIEAALAEQRFDDAARSAHTLRGSAGSFGARRLSTLTSTVEQCCNRHDTTGATTVLGEMRAEFDAFRSILAGRLDRRAG